MEKVSESTIEKLRHLDFITSIVLFLISAFIVGNSAHMFKEVGGPAYTSPGLLPILIGSVLMLCSVILFAKSVRHAGIAGNLQKLRGWMNQSSKDPDMKNTLLGILVLAAFSFILISRLPFMLSSFIFMVFLMKLLDAGSYVKVSLISAVVSVSVYTLFEIIFKVPLP